MKSGGKPWIIVVLLVAAMTSVAVLSLATARPLDVSELPRSGPPINVKVSGELVRYELINGSIMMVLKGRDGSSIIAVMRGVDYAQARIGSGRGFVVLEGVYYPEKGLLEVTRVLRGCHTAYSQESSTA